LETLLLCKIPLRQQSTRCCKGRVFPLQIVLVALTIGTPKMNALDA
jgi:hypothetical protein